MKEKTAEMSEMYGKGTKSSLANVICVDEVGLLGGKMGKDDKLLILLLLFLLT